MLLTAEGAVLLLIDLQERLMPAIRDHEAVVARAVRLAEAATLLDVPVRATEQNPAALDLDRVYLNGYVAKLQTPGGVVYFFHDHRGKPIVSPALFEPIGNKFRKDIKDWAQANGVPVIRFRAGERKADVMAPYLDAAAATGRSQVAAIGCAQEFQLVWTARKRDTDPGGCPQFSFTKEQRRVSVFYVYIWDEHDGRRVHQDLHLLPLSGQGVGQRARVGQAAGAGRRDRRSPSCPTVSPPATIRPGCRPSATGSAPARYRCGSSGGWPGSRCP